MFEKLIHVSPTPSNSSLCHVFRWSLAVAQASRTSMRGSKIQLPFETMDFNETYSLAHEPQTTRPNENAKFLHLKSRFPSYTLETKLFLDYS